MFFPIIALTSTFAIALIAGAVLSAMPRTMQGESVLVPWPLCLTAVVVIQMILPWLVGVWSTRNMNARAYLVVCLIFSTLLEYFAFGLGDALNKAWRRGW